MMDNPPVLHNDGLFAANHGINQMPPAIDTFDTTSLSGNGFDAIWQYIRLTELLLCRVRQKHKKGLWINSGFQERVSTWLEGKIFHDGAYTRTSLSSLNMEPLSTHQSPLRSRTPEIASLKGHY
jgi:hypothetical protein